MKVTCLSILLLATSAVAYRNGVNPNDRRRTRGLKTGGKGMGMSKGTKGMKGMGANDKGMKGTGANDKGANDKGMKGTGTNDKGANGCRSLKIKAPYSEVDPGITETAVGETGTFPVYDYYTDEPIGTYTDQVTFAFVGDEFVDCTFTGTFNFDFDESLEYPFVSQVMLAGSCLGARNAITGGTGKYACASGTEVFVDAGDNDFASELYICNTCA
jgi:hypothetical protein